MRCSLAHLCGRVQNGGELTHARGRDANKHSVPQRRHQRLQQQQPLAAHRHVPRRDALEPRARHGARAEHQLLTARVEHAQQLADARTHVKLQLARHSAKREQRLDVLQQQRNARDNVVAPERQLDVWQRIGCACAGAVAACCAVRGVVRRMYRAFDGLLQRHHARVGAVAICGTFAAGICIVAPGVGGW